MSNPFCELKTYYLIRVSLFLIHEKHPHQEEQLSQLTLVIWESNPVHFHVVHQSRM